MSVKKISNNKIEGAWVWLLLRNPLTKLDYKALEMTPEPCHSSKTEGKFKMKRCSNNSCLLLENFRLNISFQK